MAYVPLVKLVPQFFDNLGDPLVNGTITSYLAGTSTLTNMFSDNTGTVAGSTVTLDSRGEATTFKLIWIDSSINYKFVLKDSSGTTIWTIDNIDAAFSADEITITDAGGYYSATTVEGALQEAATALYYNDGSSGSVARTVQQRLRDVVSVKDFGAVGNGSINDQPAIQNAITAAAGKTVIFPPGTYKVDTGINVPAKTTIIGNMASITTSNQITVLTVTNDVTIDGLNIQGPGSTYNSAGKAIYGTGTRNGAGVAPTYISNVIIKNCEISNFGNAAIELNFIRECFIYGNTLSSLGYAGVFIYSGVDVYVSNNNINTLSGETASGELNAYGITFTSLVGASDFVRDPVSQRCRAIANVIREIPTWHALDTHGGSYCEFIDNQIINCRRGVILTNLGTVGAYACLVQGNTIRNILSGTNSNGSNKQSEGIWDIGASTSVRNSKNRITGNTTYQNGDPTTTSAAIWIENANEGSVDNNWLDQPFTYGILVRSNVQRYTISQNTIVDVKNPGTGAGGATNSPSSIYLEGTDVYTTDVVNNTICRKNSAADNYVSEIGILVANTSAKSIYLNGNSLQSVVLDFYIPNTTGITGALHGDFTATLTGLTTSPTFTVKYSVSGKSVVLSWSTDTIGTSNSTAMTFTGMPQFLAPTTTAYTITRVTDNGTDEFGMCTISSVAVATFSRGATLAAFTNTGVKGLPEGSVSYLLV